MVLQQLKRELGFALTVLRRRPFQCFLQLTNRCNMRCGFCDFWPNGVPPSEELTLDDFRRLEDQLAQLGHFLISLEGGEPFLRPDLIDIVRVFARRHVCILYTNGWFVDERSARALFDAGLANVGVSIDFPDAERHDRNRGLPGTTERAWRAVELFRDAAPHHGKQVHVMTVYMADNAADLEPLLKQSAAHGVSHSITLLAKNGYRRGQEPGEWPTPSAAHDLRRLWTRYPHFKTFREYIDHMETFLAGGEMPR